MPNQDGFAAIFHSGSARVSRAGDDVPSSRTFSVIAAPNVFGAGAEKNKLCPKAFGAATTRKMRVRLDRSTTLHGS